MSKEEKDQLSLDLTGTEKPVEQPEPVEDDDVLEWVCHPAKRNMKITIGVTLFLMVLLLLVWFWTYEIWFVALGALILFISLASFYFPTKYILSKESVVIQSKANRQVKSWKQYRTYYPDKNGVLLSPFTRPSRLENFRGVYIRFWNNRDEVLAYVEKMIKARKEEAKAGEKE